MSKTSNIHEGLSVPIPTSPVLVRRILSVTDVELSGTVENTYTSDASHTFPSVGISNVELTVAGAAGGNGGSDANGSGGRGGQGRAGRFSLPSDFAGTELDFYVGKRGNGGGCGGHNVGGSKGQVSGSGDGGNGGGAGQNGWSGGGGGGGEKMLLLIS